MIEIDKNPRERDLRVFAWILPVFLAVVGALCWRSGWLRTAVIVWAGGFVVSIVALAVPSARRRLYLGWMYATYPIGWVISHALLAIIFFAVATPIALVLRILGRDPMLRRFDKGAASYWVARKTNPDRRRYFRQF